MLQELYGVCNKKKSFSSICLKQTSKKNVISKNAYNSQYYILNLKKLMRNVAINIQNFSKDHMNTQFSFYL